MKNKNDGGPAFPFEHGHSPDASNVREYGMSLRQWYVGQIVSSVVGATVYDPPKNAKEFNTQLDSVVICAFTLADKLLEFEEHEGKE